MHNRSLGPIALENPNPIRKKKQKKKQLVVREAILTDTQESLIAGNGLGSEVPILQTKIEIISHSNPYIP